MTMNKQQKKGVKKTIFAATAVIGASTFLSLGILQAATATELNKTEQVPTIYSTGKADVSPKVQNSVPDGYKKANYTLGEIDLAYYRDKTPTDKDMRVEEAAEIGVQALWEVFGVNVEGQIVEMGYHQGSENLPRAGWNGDVLINRELSFHFSVDAVTGELFSLNRADRIVDGNVSVAFDASLDKNPEEFVQLAKEMAEKYKVVEGEVRAEYNGQGYAENDPTISIEVIGEKGEIALMTFSRHDKELLGISYSASYKPFIGQIESLPSEFEDTVESMEQILVPVEIKDEVPLMEEE